MPNPDLMCAARMHSTLVHRLSATNNFQAGDSFDSLAQEEWLSSGTRVSMREQLLTGIDLRGINLKWRVGVGEILMREEVAGQDPREVKATYGEFEEKGNLELIPEFTPSHQVYWIDLHPMDDFEQEIATHY